MPFDVVDAHVHLITTTNGVSYPWARPTPAPACPCAPPCYCNWTLTEYGKATAPFAPGGNSSNGGGARVGTVVFCEVGAAQASWLKEAEWVQRGGGQPKLPGQPNVGAVLAQTPPGFGTAPLGAVAPLLDALAARVPLLRGVRLNGVAALANGTLAPRFVAALRALGRRGLVADLNLGCVTNGRALAVARAAPRARFVVEHLGGCVTYAQLGNATALAAYRAALAQLAARPNVVALQLGGAASSFRASPGGTDRLAARLAPWVGAAVDAFGYGRVAFEANWFFCNWPAPHARLDLWSVWARALLGLLQGRGATLAELRAVFRGNALKVYRALKKKSKHDN